MIDDRTNGLLDDAFKAEYENAQRRGRVYNSRHEAYAVLREEVEELGEEVKYAKHRLKLTWEAVRCDKSIQDDALRIRAAARNAACEAVQVMAVCQKILDGGQ